MKILSFPAQLAHLAMILSLVFGESAVTPSLLLCQLGDCGQICPKDLSPVQRNDGGDVFINTGCSGGSSRFYCCPSSNMPTCTWRGQAPFCGGTSGGKCDGTEIEVMSSTSGTGKSCWLGHKVLCCKKTGSDSAIGHCQWHGSSPFCSNIFKHASCPSVQKALTKSNYGAGGEQRCLLGQKSFCCDQPPPFTGCDWYYHISRWREIPFQCKGTCPAGKAAIATDPSWCLSGYGAYCCDNPSVSGDPVVEDFKRLISTFANDPTCTDVPHPNGLEKRTSMGNPDFTQLFQRLSQIVRGEGQIGQRNVLASQFNMLYGDRYGLYVANMTVFFNHWPNVDPVSLTETLMCMGAKVGRFLRDYHQSRSEICVNPCTTPALWRGTAVKNGTLIFARNLEDSEFNLVRGFDGEPSWALMMTAIINGEMTLEYEQVILTNRNENILEIVWALPPGDGPGGVDPIYQHSNPLDSETKPDRYVVFHFHTDHITTVAGTQRPGIHAIVAFHGQFYGDGRFPRVDGRSAERNRRTAILECNDNGSDIRDFFYPGELTNEEVAYSSPWLQIVTEFGNYLIGQGLLTVATYTGRHQGQLQLTHPDSCGRQYFLWNGYRTSKQFGPDGVAPPGGRGGNPPSADGTHDQQNSD